MKKMLVLIIVLFLAGCGALQMAPPEEKETIDVPEINYGTEGIVMEFMQGAPPPEVYEETYSQATLILHNKGSSDVQGGYYKLSTERQYATVLDSDAGSFSVQGKSVFYPQGTEERIGFRIINGKLDPLTERYSTTLQFTACYPYKTTATLTTCVDTDLTGDVPQKTCAPTAQSLAGGQGAPLAVTNIEPRMLPHANPDTITPEFVLHIENRGRGQVVSTGQLLDACSGRPLQNLNQVRVRARLSDDYLQCTPETLRLRQGENKVACRLPTGIHQSYGTYLAPLTITMDYGYVDNVITSYTIQKPAR